MTAPDLAAAIDRLYDAFAAVPKPRAIRTCPCCMGDWAVEVLLRTPLREVPPDALAVYASSALGTVGGVADYLYLLPRILEVTAADPAWPGPEPEETGWKVHAAGVLAWPAGRRAALGGFLAAAVDDAARTADAGRLDSWLCAVGRTGLDIGPYLARLAAAPDAVRGYYSLNENGLDLGRLANGSWFPPDPAHDTVLRWLRSSEVEAIVLAD